MHTSLFGYVLHAISYCHLCNLWLVLTTPVRSDLQRPLDYLVEWKQEDQL